jgi:ABC-type phosphate transport system substrate-binding protein
MQRQMKSWIALMLLGAAAATLRSSPSAAQASRESDVAIVANPSVPVNDLSLPELRKIFRGERQYWSSDLPVVLLVRAPVARERDVVLRVIYQMTEAQYKQFWVAKIFRAEAVSVPKLVYSNDMTTQLTTSLPGAISFMDAKQVGQGIKVISVNGKKPGEAGYPLR